MDEEKLWRRSRLVVAPAIQWGIKHKTILATVIVSGVFAWFTFYLFWRNSIADGNLSQVALLYRPELWIGWAITVLICILIVSLILMKTTHRIAGQMYRFEKTLDQMICGDTFKPIYTRKNDYFHELEDDLNRYLGGHN